MKMLRLAAVLAVCLAAPSAFAQNESPKQKVKNARNLVKQGSAALPQLAIYAADPAPEVRLEAVRAISEVGTQASLDPLVRATRDNDPTVQRAAVDGLVNFYLPGYLKGRTGRMITAVKSRWTDTNDQVIPAYVTVRPDVIAAIGAIARSGSSMESRAAAARGVGVLRGKAAVPDLVQALRSKNDDVMYESIIALQKIGDAEAAAAVSVYLRDLDDRVQIAALETMGLLRHRPALPELQRVYGAPRNDKVRRAALTAIAMLPDDSSRRLYQAALADKDEAIRAAAAEGYARLKNPADLPALQKAFEEERKTPPRVALAFALVSLGKTELGEFTPLQYLINTLNSSAQSEVASAYLRELAREPMVREQIYAVLPTATRDEKVGIARVLAVSGDERSVPHLEKMAKDGEDAVAEAGLNALRVIRARGK